MTNNKQINRLKQRSLTGPFLRRATYTVVPNYLELDSVNPPEKTASSSMSPGEERWSPDPYQKRYRRGCPPNKSGMEAQTDP